MLKTFKLLILTVFALVIIACTATPKIESTGEYLDNSAITAKVKANLVEKLGTQGFAVTIKTYKDEVQLSGFVNSNDIKRRAGAIASKTSQVKRVRNDLVVK